MTSAHHDHHGSDGHAGHSHGVSADADRRWLAIALTLITTFMAAEVVIGILAQSLALISDAAHMLTDAVSIVLALIAMRLAARPARGGFTYGLKRAEILSAQANGLTLLLLGAWLAYEAVRQLIDPPEVEGGLVFGTALAGIVVNIAAAWCISKANRSSLNVEGAYQHILNDLFAFIGTAIAGLIVLLTGFARADAIATLVVVALMFKAGYGLVRESGRIFLEAAPAHLDPDDIGDQLVAHPRSPRCTTCTYGPSRPGSPRCPRTSWSSPSRTATPCAGTWRRSCRATTRSLTPPSRSTTPPPRSWRSAPGPPTTTARTARPRTARCTATSRTPTEHRGAGGSSRRR